MKKRILSAILVMAMLAAVLVGCAGGAAPADTSSGSSATDTASVSTDTSSASDTSSDSSATDSTPSGEQVTIRTTFGPGELFPEQIEMFQAENPDIKVEQITADDTKLMAMIAAGTAPDMLRIYAVQALASYVTRGIANPVVDEYLKGGKAEFIKADDFLPVIDNYRWDSDKAVQGEGTLYGFVKDFSDDHALIINKKMFTDAGVELPDPNVPLTYTQLGDICKKIQKMDGTTPQTYGMTFWDGDIMSIWRILAYNAQSNESPFSSDFRTADFTNKATKGYVNWAIDLIKTGASVASVVMQPPNGDYLGAFINGKAAIASTGYWYTGVVRTNENTKDNTDNFLFLPTPQVEGTERIVHTAAACGGIMLRATKYPEQTFRFMDFFFGGPPATDRAKSGWGLPMFKSLLDLLPTETAFDKNAKEVAVAECDYMTKMLAVNPYIAPSTMTNLLAKYLVPVYSDADTVDNALAQINTELVPLIAEGMEIAGVK